MIPEYHLIDAMRRPRRRRKMTTVILPDRVAKGSSRNFHRSMRVTRKPIIGDTIFTGRLY
jgi:hypothetical protein